MSHLFETASFHIIKPCNVRCKFCYATFQDLGKIKTLSFDDVKIILNKLRNAGLQKITFAGGEPLLYKHIINSIKYAKEIGLTTSIITNGFLLKETTLNILSQDLDWLGLSVDSVNKETNIKIGRFHNNQIDYYKLINQIKNFDFKIKINTVVNRFNENESLQDFIDYTNPSRWKIFDTLKVEGQNDLEFEEIKTSINGFKTFCNNHKHPSMIKEDNNAMTGSYLLIDPQGRLFENSIGKHTYSDELQTSDINKCLTQINLNRETFLKRGGIYNW